MEHHLILRVCGRLLLPLILLFALYVQAHGDYSPGGGFQAGVIFASAFILYGLFAGVTVLQRTLPVYWMRAGMAGGLLLYMLVGMLCLIGGGSFLDYDYMPGGQHAGVFIVELGVGLTVASTMILFFYVFTQP